MFSPSTYQVLLLPRLVVVASGYSLHEAAAWIATYNFIQAEQPIRAIIAEELATPRPVYSWGERAAQNQHDWPGA